MMSRRSYFTLILLIVCFMFAFSTASSAALGGSPQEKVKEEVPPAKGVSPAKPGVKPPVPAEMHQCCCCCCCHRCGDAGACKAWSKDPRSKPRLGAEQGQAIMVEKCVGAVGAHEGKEVEIIVGHPPGPKHKIMHGKARSRGAGCSSDCMHSCGSRCGSDCMQGAGRAHKNVFIGRCSSSGAKHCGPGCLIQHASVLGLTDEQQDELSKIEFATKKKMIDLKATLQKERLELQELMSADDLNASAIKRQLDAVAGAETDMKFEKISSMIAAQKVLTKEQKELLKEKCCMSGGGCCEGHMSLGMQTLEFCRPMVIEEGHGTIDVLVDEDEGECIKVIEIED